jgi:DNA-binding CsgD family transcriptional regulator
VIEINQNIEDLKAELITNWTGNFDHQEIPTAELPDYLKNHFLINHIATQSNTIIQIFDMTNFKTIYISPNSLEITGFTADELNNFGFTYWLKTIPIKQILFYIKSAKFVNEKIKNIHQDELYFSNQCVNLAFKNKKGEKRSMVSTNSCIEWNGKKQKYQLILWRDMTEKFKNKDFSVRYVVWGKTYSYFSTQGKFKEGDLLTEKEFVILAAYKKSLSSKEISELMSISPFTVDNHKKNLFFKFSVSSMSDVLEILNFIGAQ